MNRIVISLHVLLCAVNMNSKAVEVKQFEILFDKANKAFTQHDYKKAIKRYRKLLVMRDDIPHLHYNLAVALIEIKEEDTAIYHLKKAIELKTDYTKAYHLLARTLHRKGNKQEAEHMYRTAHELDPTYFDVLPDLANFLRDENRFKEAIIFYKKAANLQPRSLQLLLDLANTLNTDHQTQEALEWYFKIQEFLPNNPSLLYNIAYTYKKLNRLKDAMPYYIRTLELQPDHAEARFSYSLALLLTGNLNPSNWELGWKEYESRWKRDLAQPLRHYTQPMWDGSSLYGKTLFLWAEQGLGDTFEFIRYAKVAKELGASKVIVAVQKQLFDILSELPYIDLLITLEDQPPYFDYHCPLLSMPHLTKTRLDTVPNEIPYLYVDESLVKHWHTILSKDTNFKIGICWHGNPNYNTQFLRATVAAKSMHVKHFIPIMEIPGVTVYSLQKTTGTDQLDELPSDASLVIFGDDFDTKRFTDTAAVIKNLDLVITIDTSICHLAAGLGIPTWNLLPNPADWRWMLDCDNTPWFGNMRLFRQQTPGDWESLINKVTQELKAHLHQGKPLIVFEQPY